MGALCGAAIAIAANGSALLAQAAAPVTLEAAVAAARQDAPAAIEANARAAAAKADVEEVKASYLPRADALWQLNRASRNNVFGLLLPQNILPSISGPVLGTDSFESAWGSAAGLLFSVEVFDFGRRASVLSASRSLAEASAATAESIRLEASARAADAFLSALGTEQTLLAARANVERLEVFYRTVKAQVDAELKPGADQSRLEAELAAARNQVIAAEQARSLAHLRLAIAMGRRDGNVTIDPGNLLGQQPGAADEPRAGIVEPPSVRAARGAATAAEARVTAIERQYRPRIFFNAAVSARASGAQVDGTIDSTGLMPNIPNWAAGLTVSFPFLDRSATHARAQAAAELGAAERARLAGATLHMTEATLQASIMANAASRMVANIPLQLNAARQADLQARARYEAGLTGVTEVAEAQRLLAQAEADAALASLALWRARLARALAEGDLGPFLQEVASPTGPRTKP